MRRVSGPVGENDRVFSRHAGTYQIRYRFPFRSADFKRTKCSLEQPNKIINRANDPMNNKIVNKNKDRRLLFPIDRERNASDGSFKSRACARS